MRRKAYRRALNLRGQRPTLRAIVEQPNAEGIQMARGSSLHASTVPAMFTIETAKNFAAQLAFARPHRPTLHPSGRPPAGGEATENIRPDYSSSPVSFRPTLADSD